jgi:hypothetical protein
MMVPSPLYYEEYYDQGEEEPTYQHMYLNMIFHPDDNLNVVSESFPFLDL